MKLAPRAAVAAIALITTLALGGCPSNEGSRASEQPPGTTATNDDAATLLKQATQAMRKVTGMHVSLEVEGDVPNLRVTSLEGDISNKPHTVATGTATMLVSNGKSKTQNSSMSTATSTPI